jgi:P4 family phage/plasmid primase-like protien
LNEISSNLAELLEICNDKEKFIGFSESYFKQLGNNQISALDYNLFMDKAQELHCKTKFNEIYSRYRNKLNENVPDLPPYIVIKNDKERVSPERLAMYIADTQHFYFVQAPDREDRRLFWYEGGVYNRISASTAKGKIKAIIGEYNPDIATVRVIEDTYKLLTFSLDNHFISSDVMLDADENIINFENGILYLDTMQLEPHSPNYKTTIQIPCKWTSSETETPVFDRFIGHLTRGEQQAKQTLLEFIGFTISNVSIAKFKKALFLIGEGNSGKTQYINLLQRLIGSVNYAAVPFSKLEARFQVASLYRKRLGADADCRTVGSSEMSVFKSLTGGDQLQAEEKGLMSFSFTFKGAYIVAANDLPLFGGDKGSHVFERILPIHCGDSIAPEQRDKHLLDKLYSERSGIITKAIKALKQAIANNYRFTVGTNSNLLLTQYRIKNDSVLQFITECCEDSQPQTALSTAQMWTAFREWCKINNEYPLKRRAFTKSVASYYKLPEYAITSVYCGKRYYPMTLKQEYKQELHFF